MEYTNVFLHSDEFTRMIFYLLEHIKLETDVQRQMQGAIVLFQYINHNMLEYYNANKRQISDKFVVSLYKKMMSFDKDESDGKYRNCAKPLYEEWVQHFKMARKNVYIVLQDIGNHTEGVDTSSNAIYDITQNITNIITMPYWLIANTVEKK